MKRILLFLFFSICAGVSMSFAQNKTACIPPVISVSANVAICNGSTTTLTAAVITGTPNYTYAWTPITGLGTPNTVTASAANTTSASPTVTTTYAVLVTENSGCASLPGNVTVTVNSPTLTVSGSNTFCSGQSAMLTASGLNTYVWSPAESLDNANVSNPVASPTASTNYTVTGTGAGSCTISSTYSVTINPTPTVTVSASAYAIAVGDSTILIASGAIPYLWSPSTGLSCITCANPTATPIQTTTYCVTVTDSINGCSGSDCITINVDVSCGTLFIPNAFSPNNDLQNDMHCVLGGCIETFYIAIYNRWGEKVFESTDQKLCWDGTYNGKLLNTAVFVYDLKATLTNGEKINQKGNISLLR